MSFLPWSEKYALNIEIIDRQHRKLVDIINELHEASQKGSDSRKIQKIFDQLAEYTRTHFRDEEVMLKKHGYSSLNEHRQAHEKFVERIEGFHERFHTSPLVSSQILDYLKYWLTSHILGTDRQYVQFIKDSEAAA